MRQAIQKLVYCVSARVGYRVSVWGGLKLALHKRLHSPALVGAICFCYMASPGDNSARCPPALALHMRPN